MSEMKVFQWIRAVIGAILGFAIALWMEMTPESGLTGLIVGAFIGTAVAENLVGGLWVLSRDTLWVIIQYRG